MSSAVSPPPQTANRAEVIEVPGAVPGVVPGAPGVAVGVEVEKTTPFKPIPSLNPV